MNGKRRSTPMTIGGMTRDLISSGPRFTHSKRNNNSHPGVRLVHLAASSSTSRASHRLRDSVRADESEVDVHQKHDQGGQQEHMNVEEALKGRRSNDRATLKNFFDEGAPLFRRRRAGDLDGDLGGEVRLGVPGQTVAGL